MFNASDVLEFGQPEMDLAEVRSALHQADLAWVAEFSKERPYDEWAALMLPDVEVVCAIRDGVLVGYATLPVTVAGLETVRPLLGL